MLIISMNPVDTIANAFIPLIEITGQRAIKYDKIEQYESVVIRELQKLGIFATPGYVRDLEKYISDNYSKYFFTIPTNSSLKIGVKENISTNTLRKDFRINIPLFALQAYTCPNSLTVLLN